MQDNSLALAIGAAIRILRASRNISQRELAEGIGVDKSYICRLEEAKRSITVKTLSSVHKFFGLKASQFMDLVERIDKGLPVEVTVVPPQSNKQSNK